MAQAVMASFCLQVRDTAFHRRASICDAFYNQVDAPGSCNFT
jgi:hypothetical protein